MAWDPDEQSDLARKYAEELKAVKEELRAAKDRLQYVQEFRFYDTRETRKKGQVSADVLKNIQGGWDLWHGGHYLASFMGDLDRAIKRAKELVGIPDV
jgi:hypothetical protein